MTPSTEYNGITITYSEDRDEWTFELRGSQRWAKTLKNAKAVIDKRPPKNLRPFQRFTAWKRSFGDPFESVVVTSIAASGPGWVDVWIKDSTDIRRKCGLATLIADTIDNEERMTHYRRIAETIDRLIVERDRIKFDPPAIPSDTELPEAV